MDLAAIAGPYTLLVDEPNILRSEVVVRQLSLFVVAVSVEIVDGLLGSGIRAAPQLF